MSNITVRQLAEILGMSTDAVYERCRRREWPHQKVGASYRFWPEHVEQIRAMVEVPAAPNTATTIPGLSRRSSRNVARRLRGAS